MMNRLVDDIMNRGLKVTPQRVAILRLLRENRNHPTAEKVHIELVKDYPAVSLTTVYNTLSSFVEAGMIQELDVDPHKKRFDSTMHPHNHFHCRVCDNVYDIQQDTSFLHAGMTENEKMSGHRVDKISVNIKGVCKYCSVEGS